MVFNKQHGHDVLVKMSAKSNTMYPDLQQIMPPYTPPPHSIIWTRRCLTFCLCITFPKSVLCLGAAASQFDPPGAIQVTISVIWSAVEIQDSRDLQPMKTVHNDNLSTPSRYRQINCTQTFIFVLHVDKDLSFQFYYFF